jgi:hypothetical protein
MRTLTLNVPDACKAGLNRNAKVHYTFFDSPSDLADHIQANAMGRYNMANDASPFYGNVTAIDTLTRTRNGDLAGVPASDALLAKFEALSIPTSRKTWLDGVAGALPNVQAYLAGVPMAMRRKVRTHDDAAPIAVVVDLTTSAQIDAATIHRRGAAILALVRVLSAHRPVELWAGCMIDADGRRNAFAVYSRINTTPLDLATAAFVLTSAAFPRRLCYTFGKLHHGFEGAWAFDNFEIQRAHMRDIMMAAMPHVSKLLAIPPIHIGDAIATNPEQWIADKVSELAGDLLDAA